MRQDELGSALQALSAGLIGARGRSALLAFGGYLFWQDSRRKPQPRKRRAAHHRSTSSRPARSTRPRSDLAALAEGSNATAASAKMCARGIALRDNQQDEAVKLFDEIAADDDAPQPYRDLAHDPLGRGQVRADAAAAGDRPAEAARHARQSVVRQRRRAGRRGLSQAGQQDLAGPLFAAIADEEAPETLRRARARWPACSASMRSTTSPRPRRATRPKRRRRNRTQLLEDA